LDTREKIVSINSICALPQSTKVVVGYFDPLWAANVVRLQEIGRAIVIVADRPNPILSLRARAELVASLACVETVAICGGALVNIDSFDVIDERNADERRARELSAHIIERYRHASEA
jgi:hypothetical protein